MSAKNLQPQDIVLHFDGYRLRLVWNGPDDVRANQVVRAEVVRGICGSETFNTRGLDAAIDSPDARIAYATLINHESNTFDRLPVALQRFFYGKKRPRDDARRRAEKPAAFYVYYANQPCVLQYLCLSRQLSGLGLGQYIYRSYEQTVLFRRGCSRIMLASLDVAKVVDFYVQRGFRTSDPPTRGPDAVETLDERGVRLRVVLPVGTVLMTNTLDNQVAADSPPASLDDDDDDDESVAEVQLVGSQRLDESRDDDARQIIDLTLDESDQEDADV